MTLQKKSVAYLLLASFLVLTSCNAITSRKIGPQMSTLTGASTGIYYLPKALVKIQLMYTDSIVFCALKKNGGAIQENAQVPLALLRTYSLVYGDTQTIPDRSAGYVIDYDESIWSSDKLVIDITSDGLLDKINFKAKDQTGEIILKVVEAVIETAKAVISFGPAATPEAKTAASEEEKKCLKFRYKALSPVTALESIFDPQDSDDEERINGDITQIIAAARVAKTYRDLPLKVERPRKSLQVDIISSLVSDKNTPPTVSAEERQSVSSSCKEGICYRPAEPFHFVIKEDDREIHRQTRLLPVQNRIAHIDISRAALVEKITVIDFENGMLKQVDIQKPSEALAIASLPVEILKAIVAIPAELIQLKIDTTDRDQKLIDAQKNLIESQRQLLETEQKLIEKQREISKKDGAPQSGEPIGTIK